MENENKNLVAETQFLSKSDYSGVWRVFYEPSKFFSSLTNKKAWLVPLLIIAVVSGIIGHFTRPLYMKDMYPIMQERLETYRQYLTEEQYNETKARTEQSYRDAMENSFKWYYLLFAVGVPFVIFMAIAGIGKLTGSVIFRGKATFWLVVNVVAFAALVGLLGDVVRSLLMLSKGTMMVYTGLGILSPVDNGSFLFYLFRQVDIFSIWRIIVTVIGLGAVYNMNSSKFAAVLFPVWLVFIGLVAMANIFAGGSLVY